MISIDWHDVIHYDPSRGGSATWIVSPNMATAWTSDFIWSPNPGTRLFVISSRGVFSSDTDLNSGNYDFNGFQDLTQIFSRNYSTEWDYRSASDEIYEYSWGGVIRWDYTAPIILDSALLNTIHLVQNTPLLGSYCTVALRCLAVAS